MKPIFEVTIRVTREEEKLQSREYLGVKETGNENDPYGPQRVEVQQVERTLVKIEVGPYLNINELVRAILKASSAPLPDII